MKGVTFLELLIVIAIIAILGAATSPFIAGFFIQSNVDTTADKVISTIRKAQSYSIDAKNGATWEVCVSGSNIRLFTGTCGSPTFNEDFAFPSSVSVSGLSTITLNKRGEPSSNLTITISAATTGTRTISINSAGRISIN